MVELGLWLQRALLQANVPVIGVSIGDDQNKGTWIVTPSSLQAQAQPVIDAFDPHDPRHARADQAARAETLLRDPLVAAVLETVAESYEMAPAEPNALIGLESERTLTRERPTVDVLRARLRRHVHTQITRE